MSAADSLTTLRLRARANGYIPIPVTAHDFQHAKVKSPGKQPFFKGWQKVSAETATPEAIARWPQQIRNHPNTGILTGEMAGVDIDVLNPKLAERLEWLAIASLGGTPLRRIGKAPKILLCYRLAKPLAKMETPELVLPEGTTAQVEVMGLGQQVVAFGIHPGTRQAYTWPEGSPETVPLSDLPLVTADALRDFCAAAEAVIRAAGGRTKAEIAGAEKTLKSKAVEGDLGPKPWPDAHDGAPPPNPEVVENAKTKKAKLGKEIGDYFREVNRRALANIPAWLLAIFPTAKEEAGTKAWRVASTDIGRNLEEELSVHPTLGGRDFGTGNSCIPIDIVIDNYHAPDALAAADWICARLGIEPENCGKRPARQKRKHATEVEEGEERSARPTKGPLIRLAGGNLHIEATAGETALIAAKLPIYQRGPSLVRPAVQLVPASRGRMTHSACLVAITAAGLIDNLCAVASWERYDKRFNEWCEVNPPASVAQTILARQGVWRFEKIAGVITTPTLRPDGSILSEAGYDPPTRLYHLADPDLKLHPAAHRPTRADAEKALLVLDGLLAEFPFVDATSRAVAVSGLITPVVRGALSVVPMHAVRASTAGTGKSYYADICSAICTGRVCPVTSAAPGDEAETEKRLAGLLLAGYPICNLDNVNGELGGDFLCQAIERPIVLLRKLGGSDMFEIESRATMFATGNALRVRGDMVRRTIVCDLDAAMERPELRQFKGDPVAMVLADRGLYVSACLIVVRAYIHAGCPDMLPPLASFEDWSSTVRSALVWLGRPDPAGSMDKAREDDPDLTEMLEMMDAWVSAFGGDAKPVRVVAAAAVEREVTKHGEPAEYAHPALREILLRLFGERGEVNTRRLGFWLLNHENRIVSGLRFRRISQLAKGGVVQWALSKV